jgi:hypothetical protein
MPMPLRHHLINRMCGKYGCTIWISPYTFDDFAVGEWYISGEGITGYVESVNPRDYWENIEKAVISYSVTRTFQ